MRCPFSAPACAQPVPLAVPACPGLRALSPGPAVCRLGARTPGGAHGLRSGLCSPCCPFPPPLLEGGSPQPGPAEGACQGPVASHSLSLEEASEQSLLTHVLEEETEGPGGPRPVAGLAVVLGLDVEATGPVTPTACPARRLCTWCWCGPGGSELGVPSWRAAVLGRADEGAMMDLGCGCADGPVPESSAGVLTGGTEDARGADPRERKAL